MHKASDAGALPKSLRQRLALLERGVVPVPPRKASARAKQLVAKSRTQVVGAGFGLGFACGGLIGAAALLVLLLVRHEPAGTGRALTLADASAALAPSRSAPVAESVHAAADAPAMPSLEMAIGRSDGGVALFPLHVTGADSPDSVRVVLRDLPETAWLSSGERQDEHTWTLRLADLENLHVTLGEGTPAAFDVTVEVALAAGAQVAKTVVHVRLVDRREVAAASIEDLLRARTAAPQAVGVATPFRTEVQATPQVEPAATALPRAPLPEGLSSLGGPIGGQAPPPEGRKVWWTMPPPAWAPFANGASGN